MPVEHIRANEIINLRLVNPPETHFRGNSAEVFAEAFKENTSIKYVRFDRDFFPGLTPEDREVLIGQIGKLRNLEELHLWNGAIQASVVARALSDCSGLRVLGLGKVVLEGTTEDFKGFEAALNSHEHLREFTLVDFEVKEDSVCLDSLTTVLATIPALKTVKIEPAKNANAHITAAGLEPLMDATNISDLSLARLKLTADQVAHLADAIKGDNLRSVSLMCAELDDAAAKLIGEAIAQTTSLESLDLANNSIGDEGCIAICEGLKKNETIKHCRLWGNKGIGAAGFGAIVGMLEANNFIERLETPMTVDMAVRVKIDECLYANRNGGTPMAA